MGRLLVPAFFTDWLESAWGSFSCCGRERAGELAPVAEQEPQGGIPHLHLNGENPAGVVKALIQVPVPVKAAGKVNPMKPS
jgi:hypothetical protein